MEELYDESLNITHWVSLEKGTLDQVCDFGDMPFVEAEMLCEQSIEDWYDVEQTVHGPTGNEGTTMERWYRQAAVVLWPRQQHYVHLCHAGLEVAVKTLQHAVADWAIVGDKTDPAYDKCCAAGQQLIKEWDNPKLFNANYKASVLQFLALLRQLEAVPLLQQFIEKVLGQGLNGEEGEALAALCEQFGWETFADELQALVQRPEIKMPLFLPTLQALCGTTTKLQPLAPNTPRYRLCHALLTHTLTRLQKESLKTQYNQTRFSLNNNALDLFAANTIITALLRCHFVLQDETLSEQTAQLLIENDYFLVDEHIAPVLLAFASQPEVVNTLVYQRLRERVMAELADLTQTPVVKPTDWKQDIKLSCQCQDCAELQTFLLDPEEIVHRFRVRKDRRQHLHNIIKRHQCDMTHITERQGSPQTLVCTKTRTQYQREKNQWENRVTLLQDLQALETVMK
jgi:hypothetical protein